MISLVFKKTNLDITFRTKTEQLEKQAWVKKSRYRTTNSSGNNNKTVNKLDIKNNKKDIFQQQELRHFNMYPKIDFS